MPSRRLDIVDEHRQRGGRARIPSESHVVGHAGHNHVPSGIGSASEQLSALFVRRIGGPATAGAASRQLGRLSQQIQCLRQKSWMRPERRKPF
ncbi:hypothetical protein Bxe_A2618 [Paraburkholderia xenovorans LB400]|uniref:Uncharacterized protein n=1 Tax=Paraburkholderia xenovorans (strain LB400) TaxID=266265 RepID=Q13ZX6_PARXL|nr:hypothetical protein Bxe_A4535 [Paraburkholderia xenovorans LB400]ABE30363.1 hypothetical protein Bxe_A2618 [Paraburkholderia xenovorans LB400]